MQGGLFAVSKITKSIVKAFSRLKSENPKCKALQGAFVDKWGALCACDGFMMARLYGGASMPILADVPRPASDPLHARLLDMLQTAANSGAHFAASAARAEYHGDAPILNAKELRAFSRWSMQEHGSDVYPLGGSFVSASRLARLLDILPDACIYVPESPLEPLYLSGADGDGLLLPCRVRDAKQPRVRLDEYKATFAAPAPVSATVRQPAPDFVPASIRDAVENTPETPVKVIAYKRDGNTVCIHRAKAHHVVDNIYVYASTPDKYGYFTWHFVSLFACGYALELSCVPDNTRYKDEPTAPCNETSFRGRPFVDFLRALNVSFVNDTAFIEDIEASMRAEAHVKLSYVRMLAEMGDQAELIARVMEYRQQRERARQQAQEAREQVRIEQEKQEEQQRQQEHAQALADCRAALLSDGECKPVNGAILCELAASLGISVSLKLKGWIMNKLATVTIENGRMVMYQYNRQKKYEKGSNAFWPFMQELLDALHVHETQEQPEDASEAELDHLLGRDHTPKLENQGENLDNAQETAQASTQDPSAQYTPKLENQPKNPSSDGHTLPDTWTRLEQITMQQLLNTS